MMKKNKVIVYKIILILLIITAIAISGVIIHKQYSDRVYDKENQEIVSLFHKQEEENKSESKDESLNEMRSQENEEKKTIELQYKGHKVIGLIEIPAISLEYPILEKTTQETMNISISRFSGGEINGFGNVSLAGHNNYSGTMFSKNKNLKKGDYVLLTDVSGNTVKYEIYSIFVTDPNDTSVLETNDKTTREVTLITCKNGRSQRLIVKAKETI